MKHDDDDEFCTAIPFLQNIQKQYKSLETPVDSADFIIFFQKLACIVISQISIKSAS